MSSLYQNKKLWAIWLILVVLVVLVGRAAFSEFQRWRTIQREINERERKIEEFTAGIEGLTEELETAADRARLEKEARRTLNLKREGEEVFVVVGIEAIERDEDFSGVFDDTVEAEGGVWFNIKKWWQYFFH